MGILKFSDFIFEQIDSDKNRKLIPVIPGRFVYHKSNPIVRELIEKDGLISQGKSGSWLSTTPIDGRVIFATNSEDKEKWFDSPYDDDIYKIDTTKIDNTWYKDPNFLGEEPHIITFEPIPTSAIELIYKGTGKNLDDFITEGLGISDSLVSQARELFETINKDKSKMIFDVEYELNGKKNPLTIKLDRKLPIKGEFNPYIYPATITLIERADFDTLLHELKHADRFFRIGLKAYEEDFTNLYSKAENKKAASLLPEKFRTLFFVFYFLQREEFEAYFHSDYTAFLAQAREQGLRTHRELLKLWNNFDETSFKFYTGKMKPGKFAKRSIKMTIPEVQRPFKFSNWADEKTANLLIWLMLKEKHELTDDRLFKKVINLFIPNQIGEIIDNGYPKKYQTMIDKYRVSLEKVIDKRMDLYARKYSRILTLTQSAI